MKALCINDVRACTFTDIDRPVMGDGDVLLNVSYVGYCGSDLSTYRGLLSLVTYPRIPGHELSGVVVDAGKDVSDRSIIGRQVVVLPYTACGKCSSCLDGRPNACQFNQTLGVQREGALTETIALPVEKVIPVDDLSLPQLAVVEPLAVGFHAARRARAKTGETVAVIGCGVIGLGAIAGCVAAGARVVAIDIAPGKLDKARALGAVEVIDASAQDVGERLAALTDGHGPKVVIEAAGSDATFRQAIDLVCYAGRVVYVGYAKHEVAYDTRFFLLKELDILGSRGSEQIDFENVIAYLRQCPDVAETITTIIVPFSQARDILEAWDEKPGDYTKILIEVEGAA